MDIRWNSTYSMLSRLIEQKEALRLISLENSKFPKITEHEWRILDSLKTTLEPFYDTVKELESRRECISSVIPTYRVTFYSGNPLKIEKSLKKILLLIYKTIIGTYFASTRYDFASLV